MKKIVLAALAVFSMAQAHAEQINRIGLGVGMQTMHSSLKAHGLLDLLPINYYSQSGGDSGEYRNLLQTLESSPSSWNVMTQLSYEMGCKKEKFSWSVTLGLDHSGAKAKGSYQSKFDALIPAVGTTPAQNLPSNYVRYANISKTLGFAVGFKFGVEMSPNNTLYMGASWTPGHYQAKLVQPTLTLDQTLSTSAHNICKKSKWFQGAKVSLGLEHDMGGKILFVETGFAFSPRTKFDMSKAKNQSIATSLLLPTTGTPTSVSNVKDNMLKINSRISSIEVLLGMRFDLVRK